MALTTGMGMFDPLLDPLLGLGGGGYDPFYTGGFGAPSTTLGTTGTLAPGGAPTRAPFTVGAAGWTRSIPVDFIEREDEYIVRADIPGVHRDELHVDTHDGNVLRFGHNPNPERVTKDTEETGTFWRAERVTSFRNRNLRMPANANLEDIKASYSDGTLEIKIAKRSDIEPTGGRRVQVA